MSLISYRRATTGEVKVHHVFGLSEIFGFGMAYLYRGDELICISPNKGEYPIDVAQVRSAKANRDRYIADGVRYEPLPELTD